MLRLLLTLRRAFTVLQLPRWRSHASSCVHLPQADRVTAAVVPYDLAAAFPLAVVWALAQTASG